MNSIDNLRKWMKKEGYAAFIVPTNDPHFSEYTAPYWKCREYLSGFTGSAGTVVVTADKALLWTDSRYFIQAAQQIDRKVFTLQKSGLKNTPSVTEWLAAHLKKGDKVALDGNLFSVAQAETMQQELGGIALVPVADPFVELWPDRPEKPLSMVRLFEMKYSGESAVQKIARLRKAAKIGKEEVYLLSMLDEIAWLLNIRGADIPYVPVVIAYAAVEKDRAILFTNRKRILVSDALQLRESGIEVAGYDEFETYLASLKSKRVIYNPSRLTLRHCDILKRSGARLEEEAVKAGTVAMFKAVKNECELEGFRAAMLEDGVAFVRFNIWLEERLEAGSRVTETDIQAKLREFRSASKNFVEESFSTIAAYGPNGASAHYSPSEKSNAVIKPKGFLLIDSGGHYNMGTTDITRTLHLSVPTEQERRDYTLVLKGNIDLATAVFPAHRTRGSQLDILARRHMLKDCVNYLHGTGHGIGHCLSVHEGPQSIRMEENPVVLEAGMVLSDEPAIYRKGQYGIRTENVLVCKPYCSSEFGEFLGFETITLAPIDLKPIKVEMLTVEQRQWLNRYHSHVFDMLSPCLNAEEQVWLADKTKAI